MKSDKVQSDKMLEAILKSCKDPNMNENLRTQIEDIIKEKDDVRKKPIPIPSVGSVSHIQEDVDNKNPFKENIYKRRSS